MADVKWIKITTDVFDDEKILLIESLPDAYAIIVVWFKLLCLAGKQNNNGVFMMGQMPYTDKMLATIFRMKESTVAMALQTFEQFGMVEIIDGVITIPNWNKHQTLDAYEKKKERDRLYQAERRAVQRALVKKSSDSKAIQSSDVAVSDKEEDKEEDKNKKKKENKKETTHDLFNRLLPDYLLSENLQAKMIEWITYKTERKEAYQEQGMKTLLRRIENSRIEYGESAVCDLIDESMSNGWKGIIFDRLQQKNNNRQQGKKEMVPSWMSKDKTDYGDMDALEKELLGENDPDPALEERINALKERLGREN